MEGKSAQKHSHTFANDDFFTRLHHLWNGEGIASAQKMASQPYLTPTTPSEVRAYVVGETPTARSADTLLLTVTHSNLKKTRLAEIRLHRHSSIADVKQRLYLHTGTRPDSMRLVLSGMDGAVKAMLTDESRTLYGYGAATGDALLIVDDDPYSVSANGWLEDTSLVEKYTMPDDVYDKKENTYRAFKRRMREKDPNWTMKSAITKRLEQNGVDLAEEKPKMETGDRVEVFPGGKRGEIMFVGKELERLPDGWWVGVKYDEPVGKNDGSVKGVRYFDADAGYGGLVRPSNVRVGDFPPLDDVESEEEL